MSLKQKLRLKLRVGVGQRKNYFSVEAKATADTCRSDFETFLGIYVLIKARICLKSVHPVNQKHLLGELGLEKINISFNGFMGKSEDVS